MSFIAAAIGLGVAGAGIYEGVSGAGKKPNFSGVSTPYQETVNAAPGFGDETKSVTDYMGSMLKGELSPDVIDQIKNQGAAWGMGSGMPGSGASNDVTLEDLGLTSMNAQQTGFGDYMNFLSGMGNEQFSPALQSDWAVSASAPDPQKQYLASILGTLGGMGTGGSNSGGGGPTSQLSGLLSGLF